jgi:hypothetical protein
VTQAAGTGQVLYVAFSLGRYYAQHSLIHARDRMAQYIDGPWLKAQRLEFGG